MITDKEHSQCIPCIEGTETSKDQTKCVPCKVGFYNPKIAGKCDRCPAFTFSQRHRDEFPIYTEKGKKAQDMGATHCLLDTEIHVRQSGLIFQSKHLMASKMCSEANWLKNGNLCTNEGIFGPISDVQHLSKDVIEGAIVSLEEDDDWYEDEWDDEDDAWFDEDDDWEDEPEDGEIRR